MAIEKVAAHLCLTLTVEELKITSVEQVKVVTTSNAKYRFSV